MTQTAIKKTYAQSFTLVTQKNLFKECLITSLLPIISMKATAYSLQASEHVPTAVRNNVL